LLLQYCLYLALENNFSINYRHINVDILDLLWRHVENIIPEDGQIRQFSLFDAPQPIFIELLVGGVDRA
jgi:hypothetical protein